MNRPTYTTNDSQFGTNKTVPRDYYSTWTAAAPNPTVVPPARYYRSASGYPTGPEYVSSSKRHGEKPSPPVHDHRVRSEMSDSHRFLAPSQARHRDPDPSHSRSRRKDIATEPTPPTSAPRASTSNDPNPPQPVQYERWIPPGQHSPSQQQERQNKEREKHEKEKDREKPRPREDYYRERRDQDNTRERHKRRANEGESDWERERERRERREKEKYREWERQRARDQDRERVKEEYVDRLRSEKNNTKGPEQYQDETEQVKYMELERQRAAEKERDRELEKERRRQEKERERERRREKERTDDARVVKTDTERDRERERRKEREKERELARRERDYRREFESGRESDRDPDRRRKRGGWEQEKFVLREDQPLMARESPQRNGEHDQVMKTHDTATRRYQVVNIVEAAPIPLVGRDQEVERARHSRKDPINLIQKEYEKAQKVADESEGERVRYSDKENIIRREQKAHEKMKRIAAMRSYADRATDSERENPSHRDVPSSVYQKPETVFRGAIEPETVAKPATVPSVPRVYPKDAKGPPVTQPGYLGTGMRTTIPESSRPAVTSDGGTNYGYAVSVPRPVDPNNGVRTTMSETPRQASTNDSSAGHSYTVPVSRPVDPSAGVKMITSESPRQAITDDSSAGHSYAVSVPRPADPSAVTRTTTSESPRQAITNDSNASHSYTVSVPRPVDPSAGMRTTASELPRQGITNGGNAGYVHATPLPRTNDSNTHMRTTTEEAPRQATTNDSVTGYGHLLYAPRAVDPIPGIRATAFEMPRQANTTDSSTGYGYAMSIPRPVDPNTRTITSETPSQAIPNDGNHAMYAPRSIDPPASTTPKHSPISNVSINGESPRLDSNGQEARARQGPSTQRTLKRQSRMTNLFPEQITVLAPIQAINKHNQPQEVSQFQADPTPVPAPGHAIRPGKDNTRPHATQLSTDILGHPLRPPSSIAIHGSTLASMNHTTNRGPTRDSMAFPHSTHDKRSAESSRLGPKDLQGTTLPEAPLSMEKVVNHVHNPTDHTMSHATPHYVNLHPPISGPDTFVPQVVTYPATLTERVASKESSKSGSRGTENLSIDMPLRRPFSALGGPSLRERDEGANNVTHVPVVPSHLTNAAAPQPYPVDRSTSIEGQYSNGSNESQLPSSGRRPTTSAHEPKQDAVSSRVHSKVPISENSGMLAPNHAALRTQMDAPQRSVPTVDKRSQPEPPPMTRVASRSMAEPAVVNPAPMNKPRPGKQGRDEGGQSKRAAAEAYHKSYSVNPGAALRSLAGQHKSDDPSFPVEDPARSEANQQYSPGIPSRREASALPKGPNVASNVDVSTVPRIMHPRAQTLGHGLSQSSPGKAAERSIVILSDSPSSRPIDEKHGHVIQLSVERLVAQTDAVASRDPPIPTRNGGDKIPDNNHSTERAVPVIPTSGAVESDVVHVSPGGRIHSASQNTGVRNLHDSTHMGQHQHRRKSQYPVIDSSPVGIDSVRTEIKEGFPSKKTQSPNKGHIQLNSREEQGTHRAGHDMPRPTAESKPALHHEGLAKVLDQPVGKTGTSPRTHGHKNIPPQVETHTNVNEVDRRHPSDGTPKAVPQMPPQTTPSPVVKPLYHNNKSETSHENSQRTADPRPNEYPPRHSIYRSSSLYPAPSNPIPSSVNYSKNSTTSSHTIFNHPQANSLPPPTLHVTKIKDSPSSHQQNIPLSIPPRDVRETTPIAHNQQMLPDTEPLDSKHAAAPNRSYSKEPDPILQRTARPDNSRLPHSKLHAPTPSNQPPEPSSSQAAYQHSLQPAVHSHITERGPIQVPVASLLFSKGADQITTQTSLESSNGDNRDALNNHPARGAEHSRASLHMTQDFEKHEPRLITPKAQKPLELHEESHHKSASLDHTRARPPQPSSDMHKKSESLDTAKGKPLHEQSRPPEIWYPPASAREDERDRRRHHVATGGSAPAVDIPAGLPMERNLHLMIPLDEAAEQARFAGRSTHITDVKVYRYLREKRNRTISALSTEAQDGTAPSTVMGSPTASILSQPPIHVPPLRDPMRAAHEWLAGNMETAKRGQVSGKRRILRPGVVFDVGEDPPLEERRPRPKPSRSKTQTTKGT